MCGQISWGPFCPAGFLRDEAATAECVCKIRSRIADRMLLDLFAVLAAEALEKEELELPAALPSFTALLPAEEKSTSSTGSSASDQPEITVPTLVPGMITPGSVQESPSGSFPSTKGVHNVTKIDLKAISGRSPEAVEFLSCDSSDALSSDRVSRSDARSPSKRRAHSPTSRRPTFLSVARLFASQFFFPNSFSYGVLANIGSGAVPGRLPKHGFRKVPGQVPGTRFHTASGSVPGQGSGRFRSRFWARFQGGSGGSRQGRFQNVLKTIRLRTGEQVPGRGEPVAVALVPAPVLTILSSGSDRWWVQSCAYVVSCWPCRLWRMFWAVSGQFGRFWFRFWKGFGKFKFQTRFPCHDKRSRRPL